MDLGATRRILHAALNGDLDHVEYVTDPVFGLHVPLTCPGVRSEILQPRNTWADRTAYDAAAARLAVRFIDNFHKFDKVSQAVRNAGPQIK
jgi:phosphoenolpyruvate carboxykinase (ATP)